MIYDPNQSLNKWEKVTDAFEYCREQRESAKKYICKFGVSFLDLASGGIMSTDLCLLAAPTGAGKTELAVNIATHNAMNGKRVSFFALEAERSEITSRLLYRELANVFYSDEIPRPLSMSKKVLNYLDWRMGEFNDPLIEHEMLAQIKSQEKFQNLNIFYRDNSFAVNDLIKQIKLIQNDSDLIIVDHIHYIDLPDDKPEIVGMHELVKTMRDLALISGKPFLVIAHLRKKNHKDKVIMGDLDDIMGSSHITKIATKAIMLAPCYVEGGNKYEYTSYVRVAKNRLDGSRCRYTAIVTFDIRKNEYQKNFMIGYLSQDQTEFKQLLKSEYPYWVPIE